MSTLNDILQKSLSKRRADDSFRSLTLPDPTLIDFSSNDYLGLARSVELKNLVEKNIGLLADYKNGATGSRLLSGNYKYIENVEEELAALFQTESALLFNSGYAANLALLSSVPQRGDTILYDELSHASIKDGIRLSLANRLPFKHNNIEDLELKLKKATGSKFIVVESVYSMDGDMSPIKDLSEISNQYNANLIIDEAHSTGVFGESGNGLVCSLNLNHPVPIRIYTFGKAMGIHGACVTGSKVLREYLINFARPFIYTTAMSAHSTASIAAAFSYLALNPNLQQILHQHIHYFSDCMGAEAKLIKSNSAIQSFLLPGNSNAKRGAKILQEKGFDVRPILSPTVSKGTERLRIILHSFNTKSQVQSLADALHALS